MAWMKSRRRKAWLRVHRWLGLALGPVFVLLGLTGSLLVFYTEIDAALEPALAVRAPGPSVDSWQRVLDALQRAHPDATRGWRIELAPQAQGVVTARWLKPPQTEGAFFAPLLVSVNPHSGEVLASRYWGRFAATWVFDLHYTLLGGEAGRTVVGAIGLLFVVSLAAGLMLWWPRAGHWRAALRVDLRRSPQRCHYDLHKLMGVGGAALLLVLAATGAALALPAYVEPAVHKLGSPLGMPAVTVARESGVRLLTIDEIMARVHERFPEGVPRWVDTAADGSAVVRVRLWLPGDPSRRFPHSYAWVHAHTGALLAVRDARDQSAGDTVLAWLHPLHNGEAFGMAGRVIACAAGLLPLGLAVTGWMRWRDRRRAARAAATSRTHPPR